MALAQLLSAMRHIILDEFELPDVKEQRLLSLRKYFPELSEIEHEELAKIDPSQFAIYTGTIFRGETSLLKRLFPMTFAYLEAGWIRVYGESFHALEFVKEVHRAKPWHGYTTVDLTNQFVAFIRTKLPEIVAIFPELPEIAEIENLTLLIARAPDDLPQKEVEPSELSSFTVGELLEVRIYVPSPTRFVTFDHEIVNLSETFKNGAKLPPKSPVKPNRIYASGSRSSNFIVYWMSHSENLFSYLAKLSNKNEAQSIDDTVAGLAAEFMKLQSDAKSEEELFRDFFDYLSQCAQRGVIALLRE